MIEINNLWKFITLNLVTLLFVGIVYFIVKEIYRIRGGNVSKTGVLFIGIIIGLFSVATMFLDSTSIYFFVDESNTIPGSPLDYNNIVLSPSLIIIVAFATMVDRRLIFSMLFINYFGYLASIDIFSGFPDDKTYYWTRIIMELTSYLLLGLTIYFISEMNLIKKNGWILIITTIVLYLFISILSYLLFYSSINSLIGNDLDAIVELITYQSFYIAVMSAFIFSIILIVERVYSSFSKLETFSTKDDVSYYKMSLSQNRLIEMIDEKKIKIGLLALFQIKTDNEDLESEILDSLRITTENNYKNSFHFKVSANHYGIFFELSKNFELSVTLENNKNKKRDKKDELFELSKQIDKLNSQKNVEILSSGAIYGIHSHSIVDLIEYARFLMTPIVLRSNLNNIIIYDYKRVKDRLNENYNVRNLPIDQNKINISFARAISDRKIIYPVISVIKKIDRQSYSISEIIASDISLEHKVLILRYTAYQTLRKDNIKGKKLLLFNSSTHLSNPTFKVEDYIKKIKRYKKISEIIIGINFEGERPYLENLRKNVEKLKKRGFETAAVNPKTITQEQHDSIQPDYILDPSTNINPLKVDKIKLNIATEALLLSSNLV